MNKIILIIFIVTLLSCNEDTIVETNTDYREVQFDLQYGFANNSVVVEVNSTIHFNAMLSNLSPLSGPEASFNILLERGSHELIIHRKSLMTSSETFNYTTYIEIGRATKYYIGINIYNDSLKVAIQDSSFLYI